MNAAQRIDCFKTAIDIARAETGDLEGAALLDQALNHYRRIRAIIDEDAGIDDVDGKTMSSAASAIGDLLDV